MEKEYEILCQLFGVNSRCWDMIHLRFSNERFCPANKKDLIAEYLIWEEFVERAKREQFVFYCGIYAFLREYKIPVYRCLNLE